MELCDFYCCYPCKNKNTVRCGLELSTCCSLLSICSQNEIKWFNIKKSSEENFKSSPASEIYAMRKKMLASDFLISSHHHHLKAAVSDECGWCF